MKYFKGFGVIFLILGTVAVVALFFSGFLTGGEHLEFQDPYSRTRRVLEYKYGVHYQSLRPTAMSAYYYDVLKQPRDERNAAWEMTDESYHVERFSGRIAMEKAEFAPVTDLDPAIELAFLKNLPDNKTRLAVIHSLYRRRSPGTDAAAVRHNKTLLSEENARMRLIYGWWGYDQNDASKTPLQWWKLNAHTFGLTPEGEPLPDAPQTTPAAPDKLARQGR